MGNIVPAMFDDARVRRLTKEGLLGWLYLLTGPESQFLPGVLRASPTSILAEGLRCLTPDDGQAAMAELAKSGLVQVDPVHRIIRIPNVPRHGPPGNGNVLRGWYRKWLTLPDCDLKLKHVDSIREPVDRHIAQANNRGDQRKAVHWREVWDDTFGLVRFTTSRQSELFGTPQLEVSLDPLDETNETNETAIKREPNNTHLNGSPLNVNSERVTSNVKRLTSNGSAPAPEGSPSSGVQLLALYQALYQAAYGQPGSTDSEAATWADDRVAQLGYAECAARLSRLFSTPPHWLAGTITFRTFIRNFDALTLAAGPTAAKPKKDIRYGTYEPEPGKKYKAGKYKLKI